MNISDLKVKFKLRKDRLAVQCPLTKRWRISPFPLSERK